MHRTLWSLWSAGGHWTQPICFHLSVGFVRSAGWEASRQEGHSSGSPFTKPWWAGPFLPASLPRLQPQQLPFTLELVAGPSPSWKPREGDLICSCPEPVLLVPRHTAAVPRHFLQTLTYIPWVITGPPSRITDKLRECSQPWPRVQPADLLTQAFTPHSILLLLSASLAPSTGVRVSVPPPRMTLSKP